jgi:nucleobase:cation symporter-1, NCS1 family
MGSAVVGWTIFGASIVPICLVIYGVLLAGSDQKLADAIASDPIGALTTLLPTWYLALFALIAILGLVGGAILDLYSSGLTLISTGLPIKRYVAATFDGLIMLAGTIYIVWIADNFFYPFQGFLITLGVPIATWSAIFITDILLRRNPFVEADLFSISGRYGVWNWRPLLIMAIGTFIGWGFVTNTFASWLSWQGYLLFLIGGREGPWAFANVGVIFALVIGFCGHILISGRRIRSQDNALS